MKIYLPAIGLGLLAACNTPPPQNNVQDVAANNMALDEVTEVQDDSASVLPDEAENHVQENSAARRANSAN